MTLISLFLIIFAFSLQSEYIWQDPYMGEGPSSAAWLVSQFRSQRDSIKAAVVKQQADVAALREVIASRSNESAPASAGLFETLHKIRNPPLVPTVNNTPLSDEQFTVFLAMLRNQYLYEHYDAIGKFYDEMGCSKYDWPEDSATDDRLLWCMVMDTKCINSREKKGGQHAFINKLASDAEEQSDLEGPELKEARMTLERERPRKKLEDKLEDKLEEKTLDK